jgi:hypothetical protein
MVAFKALTKYKTCKQILVFQEKMLPPISNPGDEGTCHTGRQEWIERKQSLPNQFVWNNRGKP